MRPKSEVLTGTLVTWYANRRYGFIAPDLTNTEIFVHLSDIAGGIPIAPNTKVQYEMTLFNGRTKAVKVQAVQS